MRTNSTPIRSSGSFGSSTVRLGGSVEEGRTALSALSKYADLRPSSLLKGVWDLRPGGAVAQIEENSCVSACGEMLTEGRYPQEFFYNLFGRQAVPLAHLGVAFDLIKERWFFMEKPSLARIEDSVNRNPIALLLSRSDAPGSGGHMVVLEKTPEGDFLVRDPWGIGNSYKVDVNWLSKWVKGALAKWPAEWDQFLK